MSQLKSCNIYFIIPNKITSVFNSFCTFIGEVYMGRSTITVTWHARLNSDVIGLNDVIHVHDPYFRRAFTVNQLNKRAMMALESLT